MKWKIMIAPVAFTCAAIAIGACGEDPSTINIENVCTQELTDDGEIAIDCHNNTNGPEPRIPGGTGAGGSGGAGGGSPITGCDGCIDEQGECLPGNQVVACGKAGSTCVVCPMTVCGVASCDTGACHVEPAQKGAPCGTAEIKNGLCDGAGLCVDCIGQETKCVTDTGGAGWCATAAWPAAQQAMCFACDDVALSQGCPLGCTPVGDMCQGPEGSGSCPAGCCPICY